MSTTFVTAYMKVYDEEFDTARSFDNRLKHFIPLLDLGINICIFVEPELQDIFIDLEKKYNNLRIIEFMRIEDTELYKLGNNCTEFKGLPINRHAKKDTKEYMFLMLAKIEFIKKTIDINPYSTDYFCWFDFSLGYIFKDKDNTLLKIKKISDTRFSDKFIYMPGCWNFKVTDMELIKNYVVWRFCGGFFIGDKESLNHFYAMSNDNFLSFLNESKTLVWEVSYWAWLEGIGLISPTWYYAVHDDTIVYIPSIDLSSLNI